MQTHTGKRGAVAAWLDRRVDRRVARFAGGQCFVLPPLGPHAPIDTAFYIRVKSRAYRDWKNYLRQCGFALGGAYAWLARSLVAFPIIIFWFLAGMALMAPDGLLAGFDQMAQMPRDEMVSTLAGTLCFGFLAAYMVALLFILLTLDSLGEPRAFREAIEREIRIAYPDLRCAKGPFDIVLFRHALTLPAAKCKKEHHGRG